MPTNPNPSGELTSEPRPRVCAVSYLNTVPLVWGMLHSPDRGLRDAFDLSFALPSVCADRVAAHDADIGILPVIEMARQKLAWFEGSGIACHGPVRSILLISKVPFRQIRTLAADDGSRTSAMLARVILAERFGVRPRMFAQPANLEWMLKQADAALLIGDAALHVDPAELPYECLDLGGEWVAMTGRPMVFAVWSGEARFIRPPFGEIFLKSCRYGLEHIEDIVTAEAAPRRIGEDLIRRYLTEHIVFELGEKDYEGMRLYLDAAQRLDLVTISGGVSA